MPGVKGEGKRRREEGEREGRKEEIVSPEGAAARRAVAAEDAVVVDLRTWRPADLGGGGGAVEAVGALKLGFGGAGSGRRGQRHEVGEIG